MRTSIFELLFGQVKIITRARHELVRATARRLKPDARILDFASAGTKDRKLFNGLAFTGGDIELNWDDLHLGPDTHFVQADHFHNPFANSFFDMVVSTNSILRIASSEEDLQTVLGSVIDNVCPGGTFLTNLNPQHPLAGPYEALIAKSFENVVKYPVSGLLTKAFDKMVVRFVYKTRSPAIRRANSLLLAPMSALLYHGLLRWTDLQRDRHSRIIVATKAPAPNRQPEEIGLWSHLKSPIFGRPLHQLAGEKAKSAMDRHQTRLDNSRLQGRTVDAVLSDGENTFPVVAGVPLMLPSDSMPMPQ